MTAMIRPGRRHAEHGFTLIEVLAAVAIGSAVIAATAALIHNVAVNFDRSTGLVGKADQLLLAVERLAADLGSSRLVPLADGAKGRVAFVGAPSQLRFVASGGAASGPEGEEVVSLSVEDIDGVSHLIRRRAPWLGLRTPFDSVALHDSVDLIEGQIEIVFAFGSVAADGKLAWSDNWHDQPLLPRLVRLTVRDRASGAELVPGVQFVLRADAPIGCAKSGAGAGCLTGTGGSQGAPADKSATDKPQGARG
jgi:prepilin-type N-terminal cleavage/methylation domain-containing protein